MHDIYLEHFIEAHKNHFNNAYSELESGRKRTHWMWFIFPIATGLGKSEKAQYYALGSLDEVEAFMKNDYLGGNYSACIKAVLKHRYKKADEIFGHDRWKFHASLTLFINVAFHQSLKIDLQDCIDYFFQGHLCKNTSRQIQQL